MGYVLITPPTDEPFTLAQIKKDLRVDHSDEDDTLANMMIEARQWLERRLQLKLMPQTWQYVIDAFPVNEIRLPFGPVQSIVQVAYDDGAGIAQVMPPANYYLDQTSYRVVPEPWLFATTSTWPTTLAAVNSVRIDFIAGHATAELVPGAIRAAMRLKVRELYDGNDVSNAINRLLEQYDLIAA